MADARWIGFDLDGTLHDMVRVQKIANLAVFTEVSKHCGHPADVLSETYRAVNATHLSPDFLANGKSANEHRSLRYRTLLDCIDVTDTGLVQRCLEIFHAAFTDNAELYPGVTEVLQSLKDNGYQIAVITERPHDSAEHALECLGLNLLVNLLVTTGGEYLSKPDGLFARALERMNAQPADVFLVGDKLDRDVRPALAAGMKAIWYVHPDDLPRKIPEDLKSSVTLVSDHSEILKLV